MSTRNRLFQPQIRRLLGSVATVAIGSVIAFTGTADAQKKAPAAKAAPAEAKPAAASRSYATDLAGKFAWGMNPEQVMDLVQKQIEEKFLARVQNEKEA